MQFGVVHSQNPGARACFSVQGRLNHSRGALSATVFEGIGGARPLRAFVASVQF
jgi:hypothetical protein